MNLFVDAIGDEIGRCSGDPLVAETIRRTLRYPHSTELTLVPHRYLAWALSDGDFGAAGLLSALHPTRRPGQTREVAVLVDDVAAARVAEVAGGALLPAARWAGLRARVDGLDPPGSVPVAHVVAAARAACTLSVPSLREFVGRLFAAAGYVPGVALWGEAHAVRLRSFVRAAVAAEGLVWDDTSQPPAPSV